jgi:hypothetical protein
LARILGSRSCKIYAPVISDLEGVLKLEEGAPKLEVATDMAYIYMVNPILIGG